MCHVASGYKHKVSLLYCINGFQSILTWTAEASERIMERVPGVTHAFPCTAPIPGPPTHLPQGCITLQVCEAHPADHSVAGA